MIRKKDNVGENEGKKYKNNTFSYSFSPSSNRTIILFFPHYNTSSSLGINIFPNLTERTVVILFSYSYSIPPTTVDFQKSQLLMPYQHDIKLMQIYQIKEKTNEVNGI